MSPRFEKIISWSPILALLALLLLLWIFLGRSSGEGGEKLLPRACPGEKTQSIEQGAFTIVYREQGCSQVLPEIAGTVGNWTREWEEIRGEYKLPELVPKTAVDIRPGGRERVFWRLGEPGAIILPDPEEQGRYKLFGGLNELSLREAFPGASEKDMSLLGGALATQMLPDSTIRLVLPNGVRDLIETLPPDWAEKLTRCQGLCLKKIAR